MDEPVDVTYHRRVLERRPAPDWSALTRHTHWGPLASLLALAAHLEHAPEPGHRLDRAEMAAGLALGDAAEEALDRASYIISAHARACGWTWPEITRVQNLDSHKGVMKRHGRAAERHPDYTPPLAHTLEAHRVRAWELLLATDRELSPNTRRTAADRLGAVLLAATLTRAPSALVTTWLDQEDHTLTGALQALNTVSGSEADHARRVLGDHTKDGPGTRADLVTYMREALRESPWSLTANPAPAVALETGEPGSVTTDVAHHPHTLEELRERARAWLRALPEPVEEAEERAATRVLAAALFAALTFLPSVDEALAHLPTWLDDDTLTGPRAVLEADLSPRTSPAREVLAVHAETAAPTRARLVAMMRAAVQASVATGKNEADDGADTDPEPAPVPARRPGYARPLERAGLSRAAADALAGPLTYLTARADLVAHRERSPQLRQVLEALAPIMVSQRPERVRTLLYLLPHLHLVGLQEWVDLFVAIGQHAPHLEEPPSAAALLDRADLPAHLAPEIDALVTVGRRALVASWAPTAPAWEAGPVLEQLTVAVEGGHADQLASALDALVAHPHQRDGLGNDHLRDPWENLAHAWRKERSPHTAAEDSWRTKADRIMPDHPELAQALATFIDVLGGSAGVQSLAPLASDQRPYRAVYRLVRVVDSGDRAKIGDALEDVLKCKPSRAPFGKRHPRGADALRALIDAYDNQ